MNGRAWGKSYEQITKFIDAVRSKERPLMIGLEYVCMSREMYDEWANKNCSTCNNKQCKIKDLFYINGGFQYCNLYTKEIK